VGEKKAKVKTHSSENRPQDHETQIKVRKLKRTLQQSIIIFFFYLTYFFHLFFFSFQVCHSRTGEINPKKIQILVEAYVKKVRKLRKQPAPATKT
jgi:F0F1-type ATP synthase membrane subunit a